MQQEPVTGPVRVASPPASKPLLVFDGDCGFCRKWIGRWRRATLDLVDYAPYQEVAERFPEIPRAAFEHAVQLIETDGSVSSGALAVFRALATVPGRGGALRAYRRFPAFAAASERLYRGVASHRPLLSRLTLWLERATSPGPGWLVSRDLFLRLVGVVYLSAFVSLGVQILGLVGSGGILPASPILAAVARRFGAGRFWLLPTLAWLDSSDAALRVLCWGGAAAALLVIAGVLTAPALAIAWLFYLSLASVCGPFLEFQWDALLLETGFVAIFVAPLAPWHRFPCKDPPRRPARALVLWILFRLMLSSGVVKLASGDPVWRDLTALDYHYWTQPLPTPIGWFAHLLPRAFQAASCAVMFAIEVGAPFLILGPRRARVAAFSALVALQALIALTGNYAFFNLLAVTLAVPLLDDAVWPARMRARIGAGRAAGALASSRRWPAWAAALLAVVMFPVGAVNLASAFGARLPLCRPVEHVDRVLAPLRIANRYGLFAVMTKSRPEIVIEGSDDGRTWLPYEFRFKPGDPKRAPRFVAPHQPRLDWQMWFAALGDYDENPWLGDFMARLLFGSPRVIALLRRNPFPAAPPRFVRAMRYDYRPTDLATLRATGAWWTRDAGVPYSPVLSREDSAAAPGR